MIRSRFVAGLDPFCRMIVDPDPAPLIVVLALIPRSPTVLPSQPPPPEPLLVSVTVPAGMVMVDPGLALATWTAPRKLQSFAPPPHTEAAARDAPTGSSKRSTVGVAVGARGTMVGEALPFCSNTRLRSPFSFCGKASTAAGASVTSKLVVARSPVLESDWVCAAVLPAICRTMSSLFWLHSASTSRLFRGRRYASAALHFEKTGQRPTNCWC